MAGSWREPFLTTLRIMARSYHATSAPPKARYEADRGTPRGARRIPGLAAGRSRASAHRTRVPRPGRPLLGRLSDLPIAASGVVPYLEAFLPFPVFKPGHRARALDRAVPFVLKPPELRAPGLGVDDEHLPHLEAMVEG